MTTDLTTLIAKLEAATGPSRELDALIWRAVGPSQTDAEFDAAWRDSNCQLPIAPDRAIGSMTLAQAIEKYPDRIAETAAYWNVPRFTASIDAALTLVPEEWEWLRKSNLTMTVYRVPNSDKEWPHHIDGRGCNSAVSLCIAALRVRRSGEAQP